MDRNRRVIIVGAGPGGLTAGMLLSSRGYRVDIYEKAAHVGGRNSRLQLGEYAFDVGPTFLMLTEFLEGIFKETGRDIRAYLDIRRLDPLYRLRFSGNRDFLPSNDVENTCRQIDRLFPGDRDGYKRFLEREKVKFDHITPCLAINYDRPWHYLRMRLLKALPHLDAFTTVYNRVAAYFRHEDLRLAMTFQSKYLGMSPWSCPGTFTILPFIEHKWGVYHTIGGLNAISSAMAKVIRENGGEIHLGTPVDRILIENKRAAGVKLADGTEERAEATVINADFAYAMRRLVAPENRKTYSDERLQAMEYSCSTFMLYLGVAKRYDIPHHNIIFAEDYHKNLNEVTRWKKIPEDPSLYIQNACATDPTLAPAGKSTIYVLVPVPNNTSRIDWDREKTNFRNRVIETIKRRTELTDIDRHIEAERMITPADWERDNIFNGATFNLAHSLDQMLYFRPHNQFEEFKDCYLVGGGTHPGSGLPTIYMSGKITADLLSNTVSA